MQSVPCLFLTSEQKETLDDSNINFSFLSLNILNDYFTRSDLLRVRKLTRDLCQNFNLLTKFGFDTCDAIDSAKPDLHTSTNNDVELLKIYNESTLLHAEGCADFIVMWPDSETTGENINNNMLASFRNVLVAMEALMPYNQIILTNQFKTFFSLI